MNGAVRVSTRPLSDGQDHSLVDEALPAQRDVQDPLPYEGTLNELVDVMNNDLAAWAADWSLTPL